MLGFKIFKHFSRNSLINYLKFSYAKQTKPPIKPEIESVEKVEVEQKSEEGTKKTTTRKDSDKKKYVSNKKAKKATEGKEKLNPEKLPISLQFSKTSEITLEKLRRLKQRFAMTRDQYRVDFGLVIDRAPIFLHHTDKEMELMKYRNYLEKKFKSFPATPPELIEFQMEKMSDAANAIENHKTHCIPKEDGTEEYYCENSKLYYETDPDVMNPKSIQRAPNYKVYLLVKNRETNSWEFPSFYVLESEKFVDARNKFFGFLSNNNWKIVYYPLEPFVFKTREFSNEEKQDPRNKKMKGVKTFYFAASHSDGKVEINPRLYPDYVWSSRLELNQYLTRESYKTFVNSLSIY